MPIRPIDSQINYNLPPPTPWGNNISFWVDYDNIYHSNPINGSNIDININIDQEYWTWEYDILIEGRYIIGIDSKYWMDIGTKYIVLEINWGGIPYYQNQSTEILISLNKRSTDLDYTPPESVSFGENATINIQYIDIDNSSRPISNTSSWGSNVIINLWLDDGNISDQYDENDTFYGPKSEWSWISDQGNGYYKILINTSKLLKLGEYTFIIRANWTGQPFYDSAYISTTVSINIRSTEIIYDYPGYIGYGLNTTIELSYIDSITSDGINNDSGKVSISVWDSYNSQWNSSGYAWSYDLTNGNYKIILNTSKLSGIGEYNFNLKVNWSGNPYYANKSLIIIIRTRFRNTELLYDSPLTTPKNDLLNISLYYNDLDASIGIDNSTLNIKISSNISINNIYNMFFEEAGKYIIEIDTSNPLLTIGSHYIQILFNSSGKPFYTNKSTNIAISIRRIKTDLKNLEYNNNIPWNDTLSIQFIFNDTDHNYIGLPISEANVSTNWNDYNFINNGPGAFTLNLFTNISVGNYLVWFSVNKSNIYENRNISLTFTIRRISTDYQTNVSFLSNWRWGLNFTAEIDYLDIDHDLNVSNLGLSNIIIESEEPWNSGANYSINLINNKYYLEFNTSYTYEGKVFYINISIFQTNYETQNFSIRVTIRFPPISVITTQILPGTTVAWGDNLTITTFVNDSETSQAIANAYLWLENANIWPSDNYTIINQGDGSYTIKINTTWAGRNEGTYELSIYASAPNYHNSSAKIIITVKKASTELLIVQSPSQIQYSNIGNITFWYNSSEIGREGGLENAVINVYYRNSTGYYQWNNTQINGEYQIVSLSGGKYRLILNSSSNLGIGRFTLFINASLGSAWGIWANHYQIGETQYILTVINRKTTFITTTIPSGSIPWNSTFTVNVAYNDSNLNLGLENANISVVDWITYWSMIPLGNGIYEITFNSSYINPENFSKSIAIIIAANKTNYEYKELVVYVTIRPILTQVSYTQPGITPKNNTAHFTITYKDLDNDKFIENLTEQVSINSNLSAWSPSANFIVNEIGNGQYNISIDTSYLPFSNMTYNILFNVNWFGIPYYANKSFLLNLKVRIITTVLYIESIPPSPLGKNVNLMAHYYVSDTESILNNQPIESAAIFLPLNYTPYSVQNQGNGIYLIDLDNSSLPSVGDYNLWVSADQTHFTPANITLSFNVRSRQTIITYDIPDQTPFGDNITISSYFLDTDKSNELITNSTGEIVVRVFNSTLNEITNTYAWIRNETDVYLITINTSRLNTLGAHNFTVEFDYIGSDIKYNNASKNIIITTIARNSELTYTAPVSIYFGGNSTFNISYLDLDGDGVGISNNSQNVRLNAIIDNNLSYTQYWIEELESGVYQMKINTSKIIENKIGLHTISINISYHGKPFYNNRTIQVSFATRSSYTDHLVLIGNTKTESYTGWRWGKEVPIYIYYNNSDTMENIKNANISVAADAPYNHSSNLPLINYNNGTFFILMNGTVPTHGVTYHLEILLFKDETINNQSFTISISFIKNLTNIFFKRIDYSVPWNDNATMIFSYNDTESPGNPGIPDADISITSDRPAAVGYYTDPPIENTSLGSGVYVIILNTSWAPNNITLIKFTITAERYDLLPITTSITIQISPISCELSLIDRNYTVWKDDPVQNFNVTLNLIDTDHENIPISNNSKVEYENVKFYLKYNNILHLGTWEYGNYSVIDLGSGDYKLTFDWREDTPELIEYNLQFYVNGSHLDLNYINIIFNLKIHFHITNISLDWNYVYNVLNKTEVAYFEPYQPDYYYGDIVNITFYWYDLNATNKGLSPAIIRCNWSSNYYTLTSLYQKTKNESYRGLYTISLETQQYKNMIGDYKILFNATYSLLEIEYIVSNKTVDLSINSVPTDLSLVAPSVPAAFGDFIILPLNYTNTYLRNGISKYDQIIIKNASTGDIISRDFYYEEPLAPGFYNISLESTIWSIGTHNITIELRKLNYDPVIRNFSITVRKIYTEIRALNNIYDIMYRKIQVIQFNYYDLDHNDVIKVGGIEINTNYTGIFNVLGYDISGIARIELNASLSVGLYPVMFYIEAPYHEIAYRTAIINISKAETELDITIAPDIEIYQGGTITFTIQFNNTFGETIDDATVTYSLVSQSDGSVIATGTLSAIGNGKYQASINTISVWEPGYYEIVLTATPDDANYSSITLKLDVPIYVNSMFQHPIAIVIYIIIGAIGAALVYRKVKWWLKPEILKKIIKSTRSIRKGKSQVDTPIVKTRVELFTETFNRRWAILGLDMKTLKVISPEVLSFASEISAVLRSRITSTEAEQIINYLRQLPNQAECENYLQSIDVPPGATRRLLEIIGIIQKEKVEILEFARVLSEIKGTALDYAQAEEIMKVLTTNPEDADGYLKAMIIPKEDRQKILEMLGISKKKKRK
ncbi:MAG: hypothetical protein EU551_00240 [Promethearchaeota archaeon]|nr:MAG: hypothetical protein EU551_00240 [Candidatus Lokiarchaeota archaeon]